MNNIIQDCFPNRTYPRLTGYDYSSPGAYFVTVCAYQKQCLFGKIENGTMHLNPYGEVVQKCWQDLQNHYAGINNEFFIVMPNHVHGIVVITNTNRRSGSYISSEAEYLRLRAYGNPTLQINLFYPRSSVLLKHFRQGVSMNPGIHREQLFGSGVFMSIL
jgi:REP element-mobilizing transposase RayT